MYFIVTITNKYDFAVQVRRTGDVAAEVMHEVMCEWDDNYGSDGCRFAIEEDVGTVTKTTTTDFVVDGVTYTDTLVPMCCATCEFMYYSDKYCSLACAQASVITPDPTTIMVCGDYSPRWEV